MDLLTLETDFADLASVTQEDDDFGELTQRGYKYTIAYNIVHAKVYSSGDRCGR